MEELKIDSVLEKSLPSEIVSLVKMVIISILTSIKRKFYFFPKFLSTFIKKMATKVSVQEIITQIKKCL